MTASRLIAFPTACTTSGAHALARPIVAFARHSQSRPTPQQVTRWHQMTPAERLAAAHYARGKRYNGGKNNGWWSGKRWEWLCERAGWRCTYCGRCTHDLSPDHVRALSRGGSNEWRNIVPACPECQAEKGARSFVCMLPVNEFLAIYFHLHPEEYEVWQSLGETEGEEAA